MDVSWICKPGQCYVGGRLLPMQHPTPPPLPSMLVMDPKEQKGHYSLAPETSAGVARKRLSTMTNCLRDSNSGFFLEVTPEAIPKEG